MGCWSLSSVMLTRKIFWSYLWNSPSSLNVPGAVKLTLEEMQGGTFTITNLGGLGGTNFTPIINAPEVAILGLARSSIEPVYNDSTGQFTPRLMLPLALSYDHRLIDGADGVRFLRWVVEALQQPFLLALEG